MQTLFLKRDEFFLKAFADGVALTFDDVTLVPGKAECHPNECDLTTKFSSRIDLQIPLIGSPMDTVMGSKMAIGLAENGGIGVIHKNLTIEEQADQVGRVKNKRHGLMTNPICTNSKYTIGEFRAWCERKDWGFQSFPVIDDDCNVIGLMTGNDLDFCVDDASLVGEKCTKLVDLKTAEVGTEMEDAYTIMQEHKKKVLLLVDKDRRLHGMYTWLDVDRNMRANGKPMCVDSDSRLRVAAAIGTGDYERLEALAAERVDAVVIDSSHGNCEAVLETVREIRRRSKYQDIDVVAGNFAEDTAIVEVIIAGADAVKVGIGPGSICTTRLIGGAGVPQMSAVYAVLYAMENGDCRKVPIIADGGIRYSGDVVKAISAGARSAMLGGLFAGVDEAPGDIVLYQGVQRKSYRGMGSLGAMKHKGSRDRYHHEAGQKTVPEGVEGMVPCKGPLKGVLDQLVGGIRSGMGQVGVANIEKLRTRCRYIRCTPAGRSESHPHDVMITKDAPNYPVQQ